VEDRAVVHDRNNVFVPTFSGFSVTPGEKLIHTPYRGTSLISISKP